MPPTPDLTLIVLAFDEEENIVRFLEDCLAYLDTLDGDHEIVVVDDGSTDRTRALADEVAGRDGRVRVLSHPTNRGMGAGMRSGFAAARGQYAVALPADSQVRARELDKMLPELERASIVLSVYIRRADRLYRIGLSIALRLLMRLLIGVSFRLEGIYLFPVALARQLIDQGRVRSATFFFSFELIHEALQCGHPVRTVTIECLPRAEGRSKIANLRRIARVVDELLSYRQRLRAAR